MKVKVTPFMIAAMMLFTAIPAFAQPQQVTVREIQTIPQANIDQLNALGNDVTENDINSNGNALVFNDLVGTEISFTGVVLSDPLNSGLAGAADGVVADRIHVFVRDTTAATAGNDGMTIQLVDGSWQTTGLGDLLVGDVVDIVANVSVFGATMQLEPISLTTVGSVESFNLPASVMEPVTLTTSDLNASAGDGVVLPNWDNLSNIRNQYVRIEGARVVDRDVSSDRPNLTFSSDDGVTFVNFYDTSIRYRNDRDGTFYDDLGFNTRMDDFVPPPIGATVNIQGFLSFNSDDPFNRSGANDGGDVILNINPFADSDLEVTAAPPTIVSVSRPGVNPATPGFDVTAVVTPGTDRTITRVEIIAEDLTNGGTTTSSTTADGDDYTGTVAIADGVEGFISYTIEAEDDLGAVVTSDPEIISVTETVDSIEKIKRTADDGPGNSPFKDIVTTMNITAIVQTDPGSSGIIAVQDDEGLAPWSGIFINPDGVTLSRGDLINITEATPVRRDQFGFANETWLTDVTMTVMSSGNATYPYKEVNTDLLQDESIAEAHQGMMLKFNDVEITNNDAGFGQWEFGTVNADDTVQDAVQADDVSPLVAGGVDTFTNGDRLEFIQGAWIFAFGTYRVLPEDPATDYGSVNVSNEDLSVPGAFGLAQNFPNPFNPVTAINYAIPAAGHVTLEVFDILGRSVSMLVDGAVTAGEHTVRFDAADLPSGMYLYRLSTGENVTTKKMLLLK